jgi:hypothetical protein
MKTIPLYQYSDGSGPVIGYAKVDDEDYNFLNQWFWELSTHNGAALRNRKGLPFYMQDAVWERAGRHGIPSHISGNPLDNQRANLTLGIPALDTAHRRTVTWDKDKEMWRLETPSAGGDTLVGFFSDPKDGKTNLEQIMDVLQKSKPEPETKHFKEITWNECEQMFCATVSFGENHSHPIFFDDLYGLLAEVRRTQEIHDAERELPTLEIFSYRASGIPGVAWDKLTQQWQVWIWIDDTAMELGRYPDLTTAKRVLRLAEEQVAECIAPKEAYYTIQSGKWEAKDKINGQMVTIGHFDELGEAFDAVKQYFNQEKP